MLKTTYLALLFTLFNIATPVAQAGEYGCKVILCLANPAGPKAASDCVPPINQLYHDLAKGKPFPTCDEAGPGTRVSFETTWADCPQGTTALNTPQSGIGIWGTDIKYCGQKSAYNGIGGLYGGWNGYSLGGGIGGIGGIGGNNQNVIAIQPDRGFHVYVDNELVNVVRNQ